MKHDFANVKLTGTGVKRILWADGDMPVLAEVRKRFSRELSRYIKATPEAALKLPFVLSKTLGPVLGSDHLAFLWGLIWSASEEIKAAMARVGFPEGEDQAETAYQAIMDHPQGIWLGRLDPEKNLSFVAHEDGRVHLRVPELMDGLKSVTPEAEDEALTLNPEFPMILVAGWHYDYNVNTAMRDPAWNGNRRTGCLAVHPQDATELGIADGEFGKLTTKAGAATVEIEISNLTTPGMVILPQGFGLNFNGRSVGVNVNLLTHAGHRDPITAVPCHRRVPCRLEKTVK